MVFYWCPDWWSVFSSDFRSCECRQLLKAVAGCIREGSSPSPDEVVKCFTNAGVAADDQGS